MKELTKENILQMIVLGSSIAVVILVGQLVINTMNEATAWGDGFCADKLDGDYNVSGYTNNNYIKDNITCIDGDIYLKVDAT